MARRPSSDSRKRQSSELSWKRFIGEGGGTEGVLQDEEVAFPVGIAVGIVFPELVPGQLERCSPVEAVCKPVAGGLAA